MADSESSLQNERGSIETIYEWIEFEIQSAFSLLSLYKKDNVNLILLLLALIGFFAFVPLDIFLYNWFQSAVIMIILGSSFPFMVVIGSWCKQNLYKLLKLRGSGKPSFIDLYSFDKFIPSEPSTSPQKRDYICKYVESKLIGTYYLTISIFNLCNFIFLLTAMLAYYYCVGRDFDDKNSSFFEPNLIISVLLISLFLLYVADYLFLSRSVEKRDFKSLYLTSVIISMIVFLIALFIEVYGNFSSIPPFIRITDSTQISVILFDHANNISSFSILLIVCLYSLILYLVMIEYYCTAKYVDKVNQKLLDLLELKSKIDLYHFGATSELDLNLILRKLSTLKMVAPQMMTIYWFFSISIPFDRSIFEEVVTLAIYDKEKENQR